MALLMISFLRKEPSVCLNFVMHYNIPLFFLENIDFKIVRSFLLMICSPSSLYGTVFQKDLIDNFWRYLKYTGFFVDLARKMFSNQPVPKEKLSVHFKPFNGNLISLTTFGGTDTDISLKFDDDDEQMKDGSKYILTEDKKALKSDIDQIKEVLLKKRKFKTIKSVAHSISTQNKGMHAFNEAKLTARSNSNLSEQPSAKNSQRTQPRKDTKKTPKAGREESKESLSQENGTHGNISGNLKEPGEPSTPNWQGSVFSQQHQARKSFKEKEKEKEKEKLSVGRNTILLIPQLQSLVNLTLLDDLYPNPIKIHSKESLLTEAKNWKYSVEYFMENEEMAIGVCDFLLDLVGDIVMTYDPNPWRDAFGLKEKNILFLLTSMFEDSESELFTVLFRNYLLKISLAFTTFESSSESCGNIINALLEAS